MAMAEHDTIDGSFNMLKRLNSLQNIHGVLTIKYPAGMAGEYDLTLPSGTSRSHGIDPTDEPEQEFLTDPGSKFDLLSPLGMNLMHCYTKKLF